MISLNQVDSSQVLNNCISVQVAASYSGYTTQYLRRLLRNRRLKGIKVGQLWLINKTALDIYLEKAKGSFDQRFGPK